MAVSWTPDQEKAIHLSDRNILVSAAAGSGKTAVLVQRIIEKITDKEHPVDLDHLLVVTFTNAAAGEMRERVRAALEKLLEEHPEQEQIRRQKALVPHAKIMTIDSFCLAVLRSYFYRISLDPSFRIGDEGELRLMQSDVLDEVLQEFYAEKDPDFCLLADSYTTARGDQTLKDMIERLYTFAQSNPWPKRWLEECSAVYEVQMLEELEQMPWLTWFLNWLKRQLEEILEDYDRMRALCKAEDGPAFLEEFVAQEQEMVRKLADCEHLTDWFAAFEAISFKTRPRKKKVDVCDEGLVQQVVDLRDAAKKQINDWKKQYFAGTPEEMLTELQECRPAVRALVRVTDCFQERFSEKKRQKNLVDFSDVEHLALQILTTGEKENCEPSEVALAYAEQFEEILIDEYQDSNYVQEYLLNSISRERMGHPNMFLVGDVKQSIYAFRLAKPELFMHKYDTYTLEEGPYQKLELHQNFRSRREVLFSVNYLFRQMMRRDLGNVEYDAQAALYPGAVFEKTEACAGGTTELLLLDPSEEEVKALPTEGDEEREVYHSRELEAGMIVKRIRELVDPEHGQKVWDAGLGAYRPAGYGDIVILLRTMSGWAETFTEVLSWYGIPAYAESRSGYFSTQEVRMMLDVLQILDNPAQDIPLTAVLHSPIGGLTAEELAEIRLCGAGVEKDMGFYSCVLFYAEHYKEGALAEKVAHFLDWLSCYRKKAVYLPLQDLLRELYEETGYYHYVTAMPGGARRKANLDLLLGKAAAYEKTSYSGLFQFVRYIEKLEKYQVDFGEASLAEDAKEAVRIMSIHKSKGLEFPIVILAGMGKSFNRQDTKAAIVLHPDYGIGMNVIRPETRTRKKTKIRQIFQMQLQEDATGEELRILYVAMTRAKEKLIITGYQKDAWGYLEKQRRALRIHQEELPFRQRAGASRYLDWIVPAMLKHQTLRPIYEHFGVGEPFTGILFHEIPGWEMTDWQGFSCEVVPEADLQMQELMELVEEGNSYRELLSWVEKEKAQESEKKESERESVEDRFSYDYAYGPDSGLHAIVSVSELKKARMQELEAEEGIANLYAVQRDDAEEESEEKKEPDAAELEERRRKAAERGTALHHILELLPFREEDTLQEEIAALLDAGACSKEEWGLVSEKQLEWFWNSPLARRMKKAAAKKQLKREIPFVMGILPAELDVLTNKQPEEKENVRRTGARVLVQGILDAAFEEEDGWILVDYKTDSVPREDGEDILQARYALQLRCYEEALQRLSGKPVVQKWLYSFSLGKAIVCE